MAWRKRVLAADIREVRHADPERALFPAARVARLFFEVRDVRGVHVRELPVRDARGELEHVLARGCFGADGRDAARMPSMHAAAQDMLHSISLRQKAMQDRRVANTIRASRAGALAH